MPNHYTVTAICVGCDYERMGEEYHFDVEEFIERHEETNFCQLVMPMPEPIEQVPSVSYSDGTTEKSRRGEQQDWYEWANENWGTKWGTYNTKAFALGGDCFPFVISFECAWGPPKILGKIDAWLRKTYGFTGIKWTGCDPYNDGIHDLEIDE